MRARHHRFARSQLLATRAAEMRAALNPAETAFWEIRGRKLGRCSRRQVVVCPRYIADFYAPTLRLVVESTVPATSSSAPRTRVEIGCLAAPGIERSVCRQSWCCGSCRRP
jgi:hypothetical protein